MPSLPVRMLLVAVAAVLVAVATVAVTHALGVSPTVQRPLVIGLSIGISLIVSRALRRNAPPRPRRSAPTGS